MKRKAIALLRVSTEGQAVEERAGLRAQRREIERIAASENLELVDWLELAGVSGARVLEDPRFAELLGRLRRGGIAGVVVADFDRLFRRARYSDFAILDAFAESGAVIFTASGVVDPTDEGGGLLAVLRGELGGMERRRIRERTMRAKEVHRRAGRHVAGAHQLPRGVTYSREAGWSYSPDALIVREAFERVLAGERNLTRLARELGMKRTSLQKLLRHPLYMGVRRVDKRKIGGRLVPRAPLEVIEQRVIDEPLVPPEDWQEVQEILDGRPRPTRTSAPALLAGLAVCDRCGYRMHVRTYPTRWAYRCKPRAPLRCTAEVVGPVADAAAAEVIAARLASPEVLAAAIEAAREREARGPQLADAEREAKRLREERERVAIAFERGIRTAEDAERRVREIDAALRRLEAEVQADLRRTVPTHALARRIARTFARWDTLPLADRRALLVAAVAWIRITRPERGQVAICGLALRVGPEGPEHPPIGPDSTTRVVRSVFQSAVEVALQ